MDKCQRTAPSEVPARAVMSARNPLFLRDEELDRSIERLRAVLRALAAETRPLLVERRLARAHHEVLHVVTARPRLSIAELQALLGVSKQTMSRLAQQLVAAGLLVQATGERDRRQRLLTATPAGEALAERLDQAQRRRVARAFRAAGPEAVAGFEQVLVRLLAAAGDGGGEEEARDGPG
jgi:DNA-binding MarR family transcriptional regulator